MLTDRKYWLLKAKLDGFKDHMWWFRKTRKTQFNSKKNRPKGK